MAAGVIATLTIVIAAQAGPQPIPDEASVRAAEKIVREVFQEDYAKRSLADQATLAKKLLLQASTTKDDAAALYVMLRDAHQLATQGGDLEGSMASLDRLAASFQVPRGSMKHAALDSLSRLATSPAELRAYARRFVDLADEASQADNFDAAETALQTALTVAKGVKD